MLAPIARARRGNVNTAAARLGPPTHWPRQAGRSRQHYHRRTCRNSPAMAALAAAVKPQYQASAVKGANSGGQYGQYSVLPHNQRLPGRAYNRCRLGAGNPDLIRDQRDDSRTKSLNLQQPRKWPDRSGTRPEPEASASTAASGTALRLCWRGLSMEAAPSRRSCIRRNRRRQIQGHLQVSDIDPASR